MDKCNFAHCDCAFKKRSMFAYSPQPVQPVVPQPAMVDTRAFGLVLPGYPVVFDQAFQRVAPDRWILPIEFAQVRSCVRSINSLSSL